MAPPGPEPSIAWRGRPRPRSNKSHERSDGRGVVAARTRRCCRRFDGSGGRQGRAGACGVGKVRAGDSPHRAAIVPRISAPERPRPPPLTQKLEIEYVYQQDYPNAHHPNEGYSHRRGAGTLVGSANIALMFSSACSHRASLRCNCLTKVEARSRMVLPVNFESALTGSLHCFNCRPSCPIPRRAARDAGSSSHKAAGNIT
jgi:hypothetical protein